MNIYLVAAVWLAMALLASLISIRVGISVALIEILVGAVAGNIPGLNHFIEQTAYTTFLASIGSVMLTFLAGAEIDPVSLRRHWKASLSIGGDLFLASVPRGCGSLPIPARLGSAGSRGRRYRPQHHLGGRGLRGHGRDRASIARTWAS